MFRKFQKLFSIKNIALLFCASFLFFGLTTKVNAAAAFVQNVAIKTDLITANAQTITTGKAVAQGDTLVVVGIRYLNSTGDTIASVTDSKGNAYHIDVAGTGTPNGERMGVASAYMTTALTASDTITITWTNASGFGYFSGQLTEYSGLVSSNWTDKTASAVAFNTQASGITSGATAATTQADELVFGALYVEVGTETISAGSGYNLRSQYQYAGSYTTGVEDKTVSSTGAQTCTGSWVTGNQEEMGICVTYKAATVDITPPTVNTYSPTVGVTGVAINSNLVLTFSENVAKGTGNILIKNTVGDATVQTIDVNNAAVTISGATVTINPPSDLSYSTGYYVTMASGVLTDIALNPYAGISDKTVWNFTTAAAPDLVNPAPGNSGTITTANVATNSLTLNWTKGTDNVSAQGALQYRVYRSTSNNIDTVANMYANGTALNASTTDIATLNISSLSPSTTYYFNVIVQDEAGNTAAYTTKSQATIALASENIYVAQTSAGSADGTSCANAYAVSFFNTSGNWANPKQTGKIGPGDTVHLCGTISTTLTVQASGLGGSPIIIHFENGSKLSSAYWGTGSSAAIYANGKNYITIDGNNTGIIEATANGDGLTNQQISAGIYISGSTFIEVKNLTIRNIYVHTQNSSNNLAGSPESYGIADDGSSNISIHNNTINDVKYGLFRIASNSGSTLNWYSNTIYNTNWAMGITAAGAGVVLDTVNVYSNDITMGNNWDDLSGSNHHNGIYAYTDVPEAGQITNLSIYGNYFHGAVGQVWTSTGNIFTSYAVPGLKIYNNVFVGNSGDPADAYIDLEYETGASTPLIANNTIVGSSATSYTNSYGTISPRCITLANNASTNATIKNNICSNVVHGVLTTSGSSFTSDYNDIYNVGYYGVVNGTYYSAWSGGSSWQAAGHDTHGINTNPLLSGTYTIPSNSPAKDIGTSLSGFFTTDKSGTSRPQGSAWDIGAYEYVDSGDVTNPTPGNSGTITTASVTSNSLTLNWTKATDNISAEGALQYRVYRSSSNNINSVANIFANGTAVSASTTDTATLNVSSLSPATTYYFNIVVADEAGNTAVYTTKSQATLSNITTITSFDFASPSATGVVDNTGHTVAITVPFGTTVTSLTPTIVLASGATISPTSGTPQDFTNSVNYTVTAQDGTTNQIYAVTVTVAPNTAKAITAFDFSGLTPTIVGTIDETGKTITLTVPYGTTLTALVPTITITGASVSPASGVAHDFSTSPQTYTVTATNASTQPYAVTVAVAPIGTHTITATAGANGSISPSGAVSVNNGADQAFAITSNSGYHIDTVTADSVAVSATSPYTFTNVAADHTISATFVADAVPTPTPTSRSGGGGGCIGCWVPPSVPTGEFNISINQNASTTGNRIVTLNFNAKSDIKKIAISLTGDFADASQEIYTPTKQFDLCSKFGGLIKNPTCPNGKYIVFAKFYTASGIASPVATSSITLTNGVTNTNATKYNFTRNLSLHMTGKDVKALQQYLNANGFVISKTGAGSPGKETTLFGTLTYKALQKFQKSVGLPATGFFGPMTREYVNKH